MAERRGYIIQKGKYMTWQVYVTRKIPASGIELLKNAGLKVEVYQENHAIPDTLFKQKIRACDALLSMLTESLTAEVIATAPKLKIIANYAVGYNNIDLQAAAQRGIVVTNTPDVLTEATADLAFALILSCARRIVEGDRMVRRGEFSGWEPMLLLGAEICGQTIGIIGAGRIGTAVARRAFGFGMKIIYSDPEPNRLIEAEYGARNLELEELLRSADFISLHVPLSESTRHLIDKQRLQLMKPVAIIVNTSRGAVIDEQALTQALTAKKIGGAGLDVYEHEPALSAGLADLDNVVLLPHLGSATLQTRARMAEIAAGNIVDYFKGVSPKNIVTPAILKK
jgi:glyoxylate reductase